MPAHPIEHGHLRFLETLMVSHELAAWQAVTGDHMVYSLAIDKPRAAAG
jgi:hypothetical protein